MVRAQGGCSKTGLRGPRPCGGWCGAEVRCRSWEWRARSEMLSSSRFLNSETCPAIFPRSADSFRYCPRVGARAGEKITELCECCFWLFCAFLSLPSCTPRLLLRTGYLRPPPQVSCSAPVPLGLGLIVCKRCLRLRALVHCAGTDLQLALHLSFLFTGFGFVVATTESSP